MVENNEPVFKNPESLPYQPLKKNAKCIVLYYTVALGSWVY